MSILDSFTQKITDTAKAAAKKSSKLSEIIKLSISVNEKEDILENIYKDMGLLVYKMSKDGSEIPDYLKGYCDKLTALEQEMKAMKQKILELRKVRTCTNCNSEINLTFEFCPKCGVKQEEVIPFTEEIPEDNTEKVCPNCGIHNHSKYLFCSHCGTKLL